MSYRLAVLRVFALDWHRAADFYQHVVELPVRFRDADAGWIEFDLGGMLAHFEDPEGNVLTLLERPGL